MSHEHPVKSEDLEILKKKAVTSLNKTSKNIKSWVNKVRPENNTPGRFCWSVNTTRDANIAATQYILGALNNIGIFNEVITEEDHVKGIEWIKSLNIGNNQFRDPALCERKSPDWPTDKSWPSPAMKECMNRYSLNALQNYGVKKNIKEEPPPGWPQEDEAEQALDWIKNKPWYTNPWGAGSHSCKMSRWLLRWYKEGKISLKPLIDCLQFIYTMQDPETGLWGGQEAPIYSRINGTFKLFGLLQTELALPLPHAEKIIDSVFEEFYRSDYDKTVGGCDEFDNWKVMVEASLKTDGYRKKEIEKMAAYRIDRILEVLGKVDGGLSYSPNQCATAWVGFDMAPPIPQGDALALGVVSSGLSICVEYLGLENKSSWQGAGLLTGEKLEPEEIRNRIAKLVFK